MNTSSSALGGVDLAPTVIAMLINIVAISIFTLAIFFRRHRRKDLAVVFWFFNMCLFVTVAVIQMTEIAAALGFGLFAILSIIRLRSEPFSNREIGYFFGALVMGLLNGIGTSERWFTVLLNAVLLVSMFVLDHPRMLRAPERRRVTFDRVITDDQRLRQALTDRLGLAVEEVVVLSIDLVRDSMDLEVAFAPIARRRPVDDDFAVFDAPHLTSALRMANDSVGAR